jgi:hypothetical protein
LEVTIDKGIEGEGADEGVIERTPRFMISGIG